MRRRPAPPRGVRTAVAWALALASPLLLTWGGKPYDIVHYFGWASAVASGRVPYRDFTVEYPPLALAFVVAPRLWASSVWGFVAAFMVQAGLVAAAQKAGLARAVRAPGLFLVTLSVGEACLYATYLKRFDVLAAALTSWALVRLVRAPGGRTGWLLLGLGAAVKLYPALLVPLACAYAAPRVGRRRAWLSLPAWAAAAFALPLAVARLACGPAATGWLGYHAARGLHLPSSYTAAWLATGHYGTPLAYGMRFGAFQVLAPWADAWARRASLVLLAGLVATLAAVLPRVRDATSLWRAATAVVAALLLLAKVLSPQFVAWLLPLGTVAALGAREPWRPGGPGPLRARAGQAGADGADGVGGPGRPVVDWPLLVLLLVVAASTAELFPHEQQLAEPFVARRAVLLLRTAALAGLWGWAALGPSLDSARPWTRWRGRVSAPQLRPAGGPGGL